MIERGLRVLRLFLHRWIIEALLARTAPVTRVVVAIAMCGALVTYDFITLGIITSVLFFIVLASPDAMRRNVSILLFPLAAGLIFALVLMIPGVATLETIASMAFLLWKLCVLVFAAIVFDILIPQEDLRYFVRAVRWPQVWVAVVAAVRSMEIGTWAVATVRKTTRTRSISIWSPLSFFDAWVTGVIAHFLEFLRDFEVSVRSRGLESAECYPSKEVPEFDFIDLVVLALVVLTFAIAVVL